MNNNDLLQINNIKEYPKVSLSSLTDEEKNLLQNIYAGSKSEFTSISQYSFQHIIYSNIEEYSKYSKEIEKISITEMKHFEIIGEILSKVNVIPRICRYIDKNPNICEYWNSACINYSTNYIDIINANIALEEAGIREYKNLLEITKNENLKEIIESILEDEYLHLSFFNNMLKNYKS